MNYDVTGLVEIPMRVTKATIGVPGSYYIDTTGKCIAKTCSKCKEVLHHEFYRPRKNRKYGLHSQCRDCNRSSENARGKEKNDLGETRNQTRSRQKRENYSRRTPQEVARNRDKLYPEGVKVCAGCQETLNFDQFGYATTTASGLRDTCKPCASDRTTQYVNTPRHDGSTYAEINTEKQKKIRAARTEEEWAEVRRVLRPTGTKRCRRCRGKLPLADFNKNRGTADGLNDLCRGCGREKEREYRTGAVEKYWKEHGIPYICYVCLAPYDDGDHVVPKKLSGPDTLDNILPMCRTCNRGVDGKFHKPLTSWLRENHPDKYSEVVTRVISYGVWPFYTPVDGVSPGDDVTHLLV